MAVDQSQATRVSEFPKIIELPASEIAVGHCVILNDFEKPCGGLVCVIVTMHGKTVWCKYLNAASRLNPHNNGKGIRVDLEDSIHNLTPVEKFGVNIVIDPATLHYVCEQVEVSHATYRDGSAREWQGWVGEVHKARADLVRLTSAA